MELLQQHLGKVRVPSAYDNVYKDECVFSFDSPESETGLYICLNTFLGFGKDYVEGYSQKSKNCVFLHIRRLRTEVCHEVNPETGPEKKITRLAIGVEGGFDPEVDKVKYEYQDILNVVVFPEQIPFPFPGENFPQPIVNSVNEIMAAESATKKREREAIAGTWDGEIRQVSKFAADLKQLDNGKKIPPKDWKCEQCDMTQNLWLNLTDGSILCGRKFFDGSGGNDHAINHYNNTKYPLAVKLGTITHDGKGDVYSYEEDDMVEDPNLIQHLSHFGIKITQLEKTEKSMVELELELNQKVGDWSVLCESSSKLEPVFGPGYTGMRNLGNSCYMNSVMQVMFTIPDFVDRYVTKSHEFFDTYPNDPANDFNIQMAKLGVGLCSGKYSKETDNAMDGGVAPIMFKNVIGKNYHDFANKLQQDAHEYFLQLIRIMTVHNYGKHGNPKDAFKFGLEDRVQCNASGKVLYTERDEYHLPLQIPLQKASNIEEVRAYEAKLADAEKRGEKLKPEELVRPKISLLDCIQHFANYEIIDHFYSTAIKGITTAKKTSRFQSFPDYLMLHLKKFTLREDWTSVKLDVSIDCPDVIDLSFLKATAHVDGEELLPKEADDAPQPENFDPIVLEQLVQMGFPLEACKKAMFYTNNVGVGPATDWIMEHITDEDFSEPLRPNKNSKNSSFKPDQNGLEMLMGMGFSAKQATKALSETDNNIERAADWIFSHQSEISEMDTDEDTNQYRDGEGIYQLVAFVSHMGTSTHVGHYVCHILKEGRWVIFNDEKVAISQNPPKDLGYLYLYKRMN